MGNDHARFGGGRLETQITLCAGRLPYSLLGFIGTKAEAKQILIEIEEFLSKELALSMNQSKSKIIHAKSSYARFLGYDCGVYGNKANKITTGHKGKRRCLNGKVELRLPAKYVEKSSLEWQRKGKPKIDWYAHAYSVEEALMYYQTKFRGIVNYYQYAVDVCKLSRLKYAMEQSLVHTLSAKLKISVAQVYSKLRAKTKIEGTTYKVLQSVVKEGPKGKQYTFTWGFIRNGRRIINVPLPERIVHGYQGKSELVSLMLATKCELCGKETDELEGHHVKKLADLPKKWQKGSIPQWAMIMIARRRKTLFVCRPCHIRIHTK